MSGKKLGWEQKIFFQCFAFPRKYICVLSQIFGVLTSCSTLTLRLLWFRQLRTFIMEQFIEFYFELGLKYKEIRAVLSTRHGFYVSEKHLKRILREKGLSRRKSYSALVDLVDFISHQLQYSGQLHGYQWMYTKCRDRGLRVRKEDVRMVLKELDPAGVSMRRARRLRRRNYFAKGPNFIWHLDSYDNRMAFVLMAALMAFRVRLFGLIPTQLVAIQS